MSKFSKYLLIIFAIQILFFILFSISDYENLKDLMGNLGIFFVMSTPLTFILGIIFVIMPNTRIFGKAFLTNVALSLLIGIGLCSSFEISL